MTKLALLLLVLLSGCPFPGCQHYPFGAVPAHGQTVYFCDPARIGRCCDATGCTWRVPTDFTYAEWQWARPIVKACGVQGLDGTTTVLSPYMRVTLRGSTSAMECLRSKGVSPIQMRIFGKD